jgi:hypothetical protein
LLQEIRALLECAIDRLVDGITDRIGNWQLADRLYVNRHAGASSQRGCQIPPRDLLDSQGRLQIVLRLCRGASCLQYIRQCRKAVPQTTLSGLLHGLSIGQTGLRGVLLTRGIQQPVVGLRDLLNDSPMGIVKGEISGYELCSRSRDAARARARIEHGVRQLQCRSGILDRLAEETVAE